MKNNLLVIGFVALFIFIIAGNVSAITASIGNSRMVLRLNPGEEIEKYVLVRNVNEFPVDVELSASGDLGGSVTFEENSFSLEAGGEKKAYFTIIAGVEGRTETTINVLFSNEEEGSAGLFSKVIILASENPEEATVDTDDISETSGSEVDSQQNGSMDMIILYVTTPLLVVVLAFLLFYNSKKARKKKAGRKVD